MTGVITNMNRGHSPAIVGIWRNFLPDGKTELLVSIPDPWGIIVIALAGIWLSWSTKYIKKIVSNVVIWLHLPAQPVTEQVNGGDCPSDTNGASPSDDNGDTRAEDCASEDARLLGHGANQLKDSATKSLARIIKDKSGIRDLLTEVLLNEESLSTVNRLSLLVFTAFVLVLASGVIIAGYFLTRIKIDGPARLSSNSCGLWLFDGERRSEAANRARLLDLEKEERAAQFAEECYRQSSSIASRCKLLHRSTLPVSSAIYTNDCPFAPEICRFNQTVTFKTPMMNAQELGINSARAPRFRRTTSCTPLSMSYPYIQNTTTDGTTTFTYHYGHKTGADRPLNYTYRTVGDPWEKVAPIYDVFAYSSNAGDSDQSVWIPHPDLSRPRYSVLTIIFISSLRILYEERSDDPLFPADMNYPLPGDPKPWFRNSDPRARPLACLDSIEVCSIDGSECWNLYQPTGNTSTADNTTEYILLYSSLYKTDIYNSLVKRQGRALMAQRKVSQYFSAALGDDHWVTEVENLVWTGLARTSISMWSVASGEDSVHKGKGGFIEVTKGYGDLCGRYKYNPQGYQSLRFVPIVMVASWLPIIWVLSWEAKRSERLLSKPLLKVKRIYCSTQSTLKLGRTQSTQGHHVQTELQVLPITNSPAQDLDETDDTAPEWEPLVYWQLAHCIAVFIISAIRFLVLVVSLPFKFISSSFATTSDGVESQQVTTADSQAT